MIVRAPFMQAEQNRSIRVDDLPEVVVGGSRGRQAKQRLVPLKTASHLANTNNGPDSLHITPLKNDCLPLGAKPFRYRLKFTKSQRLDRNAQLFTQFDSDYV